MSVIAKTILAKNSANNGALYIGSGATIGALVLDSNPASSVASHATIQYAFNSGSDTGKWEVLYDPATYGSAHGFVSLPNMPVAGDQTQAIEFPLVQANSVQISGTAQTAGDIINQIGSVGSAVSTASGYASTAASQSTTAASQSTTAASTAITIDGLLTGADSLAAIHAAASSAASSASSAAGYASTASSTASTILSDLTSVQSTIGVIGTYVGSLPTAAAVATAVWTDTTGSDFTTAGSPGKELQTTLPAAVSTIALNLPTFPANFGTMVIDTAGNVSAVDAATVPSGENPAGTAALAAANLPETIVANLPPPAIAAPEPA